MPVRSPVVTTIVPAVITTIITTTIATLNCGRYGRRICRRQICLARLRRARDRHEHRSRQHDGDNGTQAKSLHSVSPFSKTYIRVKAVDVKKLRLKQNTTNAAYNFFPSDGKINLFCRRVNLFLHQGEETHFHDLLFDVNLF